jgi:hypothetical protein
MNVILSSLLPCATCKLSVFSFHIRSAYTKTFRRNWKLRWNRQADEIKTKYVQFSARPEESYRVSKYMCDHRNPERGPMFQFGTKGKWMMLNLGLIITRQVWYLWRTSPVSDCVVPVGQGARTRVCTCRAPAPHLHMCVDGVPEDMRVADETHAMITHKAVLSILFGHNQQITITSVTLVKLPACFNPHRVIFWGTSLA